MNRRRLIYMMLLIAVAAVVYISGQSNYRPDEIKRISKQAVLDDFKDLSRHKTDIESLGGSVHTTDMFFPPGFVGAEGDEFYVTVQNEKSRATLKYVIKLVPDEKGAQGDLKYNLKDIWESFKPPGGKFESYELRDNSWLKTGNPE